MFLNRKKMQNTISLQLVIVRYSNHKKHFNRIDSPISNLIYNRTFIRNTFNNNKKTRVNFREVIHIHRSSVIWKYKQKIYSINNNENQ